MAFPQLMKIFLIFALLELVRSHGYLSEPRARNGRYNALFCGGRITWIQYKQCGVCGDSIKHFQRYAKAGKATGRYKQGQIISVKATLTAAHRGYFQLRIASLVNGQVIGDRQGKLRGYLLRTLNGESKIPVHRSRTYSLQMRLPSELRCERCVLQWWYTAGNNWGCGRSGCGLGLGDNNEQFVNCADEQHLLALVLTESYIDDL